MKAAKEMFETWLICRTVGQSDVEKAVSQVLAFIEQNPRRFQEITLSKGFAGQTLPTSTTTVFDRVGFKRSTSNRNEWLIFPEAFRTEVSKGYNSQMTIKALEERGLLITGTGDNKTHMETLPELGRKRMYVIRLKDDE